MATQARTVAAAREKATATVEKLLKRLDDLSARQIRKEGAATMPQPTFAQLVHNNIELGFNAGDAYTMAAKQSPQAYQNYLREAREKQQAPTVAKDGAPGTSQITVSHPQGIKNDRDCVPLSWDEQVKHWKEYPGTYQRYKMHFATAQRRG